ncbi:uncharacterized protein J8A68_002197 [[Candida] subhashii]|uniref:PhoD-like phosphatase domain-containing protein n=1 Tax=[Candida] subhashii TaxID=561895 RepID=A0A8J5QS44_9ASCO|nr:uncharacterized protein J8A68_002197 [[Candida] subhashii]KAG7664282.1 hypothetical protein J8A68_002197 [[Candida] subhashii]
MPSSSTPQGPSRETWFDPIPIDDFKRINELSRKDVPKERPIDPEDKIEEYDIRCGPILKLSGTHEDGKPNYRGSLALVPPIITYEIGPSSKDIANGKFLTGEFESVKYFQINDYSFFRYSIDLIMESYEQKIEYYIEHHFKKSFQFYIPSIEESMNVISFSCNGFSLGSDASEYKSSMWLDVLNRHAKQHYHVMLGGGDQIYCDSIKLQSKALQDWMKLSSLKKPSFKVTQEISQEFEHYYLEHYMNWFGKGFWVGKNSRVLEALFPLTMSQIPSVNIYDDHDIIDGYGSYGNSTMSSEVFESIGNLAYKYYMLFQHQIDPREKLSESDPSWILGKQPGPYIKEKNHSNYIRLGKEIALLGLDCRTERKLREIVSPSSYERVFDRLNKEITANKDIKHLLVMLGVPILYPRLVWLEWLLTSTVFKPVRSLAQKGVLDKGLVNEFDGDIEVLDDLNDHWCAKHHKRERNKLLLDLIEFQAKHEVRITILSGDVHLCCIGRIKSKFHHHRHAHKLLEGSTISELNQEMLDSPECDPRLMFNVISSAITNAPPPDPMAKLLNKRSKIHHYNRDTDEDMMPIFLRDVDGSKRENLQFLNKRNWADLIVGKQSKYKDSIVKDETLRKFPQPVFDSDVVTDFMEGREPDERNVKYPLFEDSLVTTIHVERDKQNFDSPSTGYEVFIPKLIGKYSLESAPVKHLQDQHSV